MKNSTLILFSSAFMFGAAISIESQLEQVLCAVLGYFSVVMYIICSAIEDIQPPIIRINAPSVDVTEEDSSET